MSWVQRAATLIVVIAFGALLRGMAPPLSGGAMAAMLLGFTLLTAYVAGDVAAGIRLPRLTGYVLSGMVIGPSMLGVLTPDAVESLRTIDHIALALIALTAGGELRLERLRGRLRSLVVLSVVIVLVVGIGMFALVLVARPLIPFLHGAPIGIAIAAGALLGVWCANSAPDATIAVINETAAEGSFTDTLVGVTILKDVIVIVAFAAVLALVRPLVEPGQAFDLALLGSIAWHVGGALALGSLAGIGFSLYLEHIGARAVLSTLAFALLLTLLADWLHIELLLAAAAAGFAIENFSAAGDELIRGVESNALVVFALFFALAGAVLDLGALRAYWAIAFTVVLARGVFTWLAARAGARLGRAGPQVTRFAWMGLLSQAGVTLGLSLLVQRQFPGWGDDFAAITGAAIIFHLVLGPVLLKIGLSRSGESGAAARTALKAAPTLSTGTSSASM